MSADSFIPFALPDVGEAEARGVADAIISGWITSGPVMRSFEHEFAEYVGDGASAVAVNSATAGMHLALEALGIGPGDEVIVPTWTFTATAEVVRHVGARPVIVDVEADSLNISIGAVAQALTPRTKAVMPVHMAGLPVDVRALRETLPADVHVVEDAAHAMPAVGPDEHVGDCRYSSACVFSFYATKTLTTGEGGMLTTRDEVIADRSRIMRLHGIDRDAFDRYTSNRPSWFYDVVAAGFKYNMSDMAAAMGRVQLRRADEMRKRRAWIAQTYMNAFRELPVQLPVTVPHGQVHAWHLFVLRLTDEGPVGRDDFIQRMTSRRVATSVHFIPLHSHSYWRSLVEDPERTLPNAVAQAPKAVSIPLSSRMTDEQVERVIDAVTDSLR